MAFATQNAEQWLVPQFVPAPQSVPVRVDSSNRLVYTNGARIEPLNIGDVESVSSASAPASELGVYKSYTAASSAAATQIRAVFIPSGASDAAFPAPLNVACVYAPTSTHTLSSNSHAAIFASKVESSISSATISTISAVNAIGIRLELGGKIASSTIAGAVRGLFGLGISGPSSNSVPFTDTTISRVAGVEGQALDAGLNTTIGPSTTFTVVSAFYAYRPASSTTTLTCSTNAGLYVAAQQITFAATRNCGIRIDQPSGGVNNHAIWIASNASDASAGISFGTSADASFWRGTANQLLTTGDWLSRHYLSSSTPTIAAGTGAGTGPTIAITGTDHGFTITLTTGAGPSTSATIATVTFGATWTSSAPAVSCSEGNSNAASLAVGARPFISNVTQTAMVFTSGGSALAGATTYIWRFTAMR